jgi:hypothetical protein
MKRANSEAITVRLQKICIRVAPKQPCEALHEAAAGGDAGQDSAVHLFPGREFGKTRGERVGKDHHGAGSLIAAVFVGHLPGNTRRWLTII